MKKEITSTLIQDLYAVLGVMYDVKYVQKSTSWWMRTWAWFFGLFSSFMKEKWMKSYATTLGRTLYLPFIPGEETEDWSLWSQLVVLAHELEHVNQQDRDGFIRFYLRYLFSGHWRAVYEGLAYRASIDLYYWKTGHTPDPKSFTPDAQDYLLTEEQMKLLVGILRDQMIAARLGPANQASRDVIGILDL